MTAWLCWPVAAGSVWGRRRRNSSGVGPPVGETRRREQGVESRRERQTVLLLLESPRPGCLPPTSLVGVVALRRALAYSVHRFLRLTATGRLAVVVRLCRSGDADRFRLVGPAVMSLPGAGMPPCCDYGRGKAVEQRAEAVAGAALRRCATQAEDDAVLLRVSSLEVRRRDSPERPARPAADRRRAPPRAPSGS